MNTVVLRMKMDERGLDAKHLAEKVGLSESYVKLITRGLPPARHTLKLIAMVLECSTDELTRHENTAARA